MQPSQLIERFAAACTGDTDPACYRLRFCRDLVTALQHSTAVVPRLGGHTDLMVASIYLHDMLTLLEAALEHVTPEILARATGAASTPASLADIPF